MTSGTFFGGTAPYKSRRVFDIVVRLTCISMLFVFAYGWRRYAPGYHVMGQAPLVDSLTHLPDFLNWAVLGICAASFVFLLFIPQNRIAALLILPCMVFFIAQDFNRLQPFVFMYMFPVVIVALFKDIGEKGINALRIMVCGVYFWAGFHKLNMSFYLLLFPWFVSPLYKLFAAYPASVIDVLFAIMTFVTPFFEALIGVLLIFPKWRRAATFMAIIMLITVLFCLGPFGHNWGQIVWPWNVYLFLLEYLLFFGFAGDNEKPLIFAPLSKPGILSIAVYVVAPVLAIFTHWYAYPGYKLYSANIVTAQIMLASGETLRNAPDYIKKIVKPDNTIDEIELVIAEGIGAPYPVPYVLKLTAKGLCRFLDNPKGAILKIKYPPPFYKIKATYEDSGLCDD